MIQFLVTAVIVVIGVFLLTLLLCLMAWVITRTLRVLFPQRFGSAAPKAVKEKKKEQVKLEDRCPKCSSFGSCPLVGTEVKSPCRFYTDADPAAGE